MSNVAKLKKQAVEFEQKRQFDKALAAYIKLLESFDQHSDEIDVALFNRVGDLLLRQGNTADAVDYYEKAVDHYTDTGFFNNAIALCNKILRHSPGRASVYYKLGKISAQKGFKNDAKVNFLEYADRMQKAGKVHEAFRALKEFADLSPDQDEIRSMLADQLIRADRKGEAVEQLQILHAQYISEDRIAEAQATADRIHALDPSAEIKSEGMTQAKSTSSDLIFIDLGTPTIRTPSGTRAYSPTPPRPATPPAPVSPPPVRPATPAAPPPRQITPEQAALLSHLPAGVTPLDVTPVSNTPVDATPVSSTPVSSTPVSATPVSATPASATPVDEPVVHETPRELASVDELLRPAEPPPPALDAPLLDITRIGDGMPTPADTPSHALDGLESTQLGDPDILKSTPTNTLLDIEPTSLTRERTPIHRSAAPTHSPLRETPIGGSMDFTLPPPPARPEPRTPAPEPLDFDADSLIPTPVAPPPRSPTPLNRSPLDGLPLMELDVPSEPTPSTPSVAPTLSLDEIASSNDLELIEAEDGSPSPDLGDEPLAADEASEVDLNAEPLVADDVAAPVPTPPVARRSTMVALHTVELLQASVATDPENWSLRREFAEAMFEAGDRDSGLRELEIAMFGAEQTGNLDLASSMAEEIARLEPDSVKHHQKRVEYAYRMNDRPRLIEGYLALGDALLRADQGDKARSIYQRVLDLAPDEARARAALDTIVVSEPEPPPPPTRVSAGRRTTIGRPTMEPPRPQPVAADSFVNLGDWLRDDDAPKDTRMVVAEQEPTGDEDADFADMLRKFKQGVAENVDPEDFQSHYDLAIAFKEMGLLDEAIAEFQKALGGASNRLPTYEALGQCFLEKQQPKLAASILGRALNERANEEQLIGVLYLLGRAAEELGNPSDALTYYQRVFVLDIQFRDIADRMSRLEQVLR
jgi:tetratricopeptide (TPR) repeat protein